MNSAAQMQGNGDLADVEVVREAPDELEPAQGRNSQVSCSKQQSADSSFPLVI